MGLCWLCKSRCCFPHHDTLDCCYHDMAFELGTIVISNLVHGDVLVFPELSNPSVTIFLLFLSFCFRICLEQLVPMESQWIVIGWFRAISSWSVRNSTWKLTSSMTSYGNVCENSETAWNSPTNTFNIKEKVLASFERFCCGYRDCAKLHANLHESRNNYAVWNRFISAIAIHRIISDTCDPLHSNSTKFANLRKSTANQQKYILCTIFR